MRLIFLLLLTFGMLVDCAYSDEDPHRLIATGSAEVSSSADNAAFTFEIAGNGSSLSEAIENTKNRVKTISESLFSIGLTRRNLRTSFFHSGENFNNRAFFTRNRDYKAKITMLVDLDSLELLEPVLMAVSELNPERISDIEFTLKDYEQLKDAALESAIKKAKQKVDMLASVMQTRLGNTLFIEELNPLSEQQNRMYPNPFNATTQIQSGGIQIDPGVAGSFYAQQIKVNARVRVIVELGERIEQE